MIRVRLLPGLVAGVADVDPTTVATMAVVGATTGYALSWLALLVLPLLGVVQVVSTQVGSVAGCGLQECLTRHYRRGWQWLLLASVLAVDVLTLAADLEAGAAALGLLLGVDLRWCVVPLAALVLALLVRHRLDEVQRVLQVTALALLAYVAAAVLARPDAGALVRATLVPRLPLTHDGVSGALALVGTTLTSYVYVWQTVQHSAGPPRRHGLRARQLDAVAGIAVAVVVCWFVLVATAATLGAHHRPVDTAEQAAQALRPLAGAWATDLFAVGLLASSLLALPVLLATTAHVTGDQLGWTRGLSRSWREAPAFYAVVAGSLLVAVVVALAGVGSVRLLLLASIAGGLATPVSLALLLVVGRDRRLMGDRPVPRGVTAAGWGVALVVAALGGVYVVGQLTGG